MFTKNVGRILFVGIGGGNDVFSTLLVASHLRMYGWQWMEAGIAGVLSPFHLHRHSSYDGNVDGISAIGPDSTRYVLRNNEGQKQISFVDAAVNQVLRKYEVISKIYHIYNQHGISLVNGSEGVTKSFQALAKYYDFFVLVDVGGDCFYSGSSDSHVLSPMFDAMILKGFIDARLPGMLAEFGPGTDGEIEPEPLKTSIDNTSIASIKIDRDLFEAWVLMYKNDVAQIRTGRTVPNTILAYYSQTGVINVPYLARAHLGDIKIFHEFNQKINTDLSKRIHIVDASSIENPFAVACNSPLDWFHKTQVVQQHTNCEANLEYFRTRDGLVQFLTPSPLFPEDNRETLMDIGFADLRQGKCDQCLIFEKDWETAKNRWSGKIATRPNEEMGMLIAEPIGSVI